MLENRLLADRIPDSFSIVMLYHKRFCILPSMSRPHLIFDEVQTHILPFIACPINIRYVIYVSYQLWLIHTFIHSIIHHSSLFDFYRSYVHFRWIRYAMLIEWEFHNIWEIISFIQPFIYIYIPLSLYNINIKNLLYKNS